MKKFNELLKDKSIFILAFIIPILIMFIIFSLLGVGFIGDKTMISSDMYTQYVGFFGKLKDILSGEGSIAYSFNKSLGGNNIGLFAYYLASPLNLFLFFVPRRFIGEFIFTIYLLKIGLASLNFSIYLNKCYKKNDISVLLFSLCYGLMAYNICFEMNIMWLDGILLLPLIALGIEKIISEDKYKLYMITLFMAIISNYYIAYMICIFAVLYFIYKIVIKNSLSFKKVRGFLGASLISGALTAALLIPVLASLRTGKASFNLFKEAITIKESFVDIISKLFIGSYNMGQVMNSPPNLYCSVLVTMLMILYLFNSNIRLKNKIASVVIMGIISVSFYLSTAILIWHGFNYPIGFPYRNSFVFIFLMIILGYETWLNKEYINYKSILVVILIFVLMSILVSKGNYDYLDRNKILATFIICILYVVVFMVFNKIKIGRVIFNLLISLLVIAELSLNAFLSMKNIKYIDKDHIGEYIETVSPLVEEIKSISDNFYRIEQLYRNTLNDSMLLSYNGLNHSSSANEENLKLALKNMGFKTSSINDIYNMGTTIPIDSILGIKYLIESEEPGNFKSYKYKQNMFYNKIKTDGDYAIYENPYALPIAFMVNKGLSKVEKSPLENSFNYSNEILEQMTGESADIFKELIIGEVKLNNVVCKEYDNETVYEKEKLGTKASIELKVNPQNYGPIYMFIRSSEFEQGLSTHKNNISTKNSVRITVNNNFKYDQFSGHSYNTQFIGTFGEADEITIEITLLNDSFSLDEVQLYYCDMDRFSHIYDQLSNNTIEDTEYKDGYIRGKINVSEDKTLMYTSIPYDEGWSLKVDGKEYAYSEILEGFIGVELEPGVHEIEFKYKLPGFELGIGISIIALGILTIRIKKKNS